MAQDMATSPLSVSENYVVRHEDEDHDSEEQSGSQISSLSFSSEHESDDLRHDSIEGKDPFRQAEEGADPHRESYTPDRDVNHGEDNVRVRIASSLSHLILHNAPLYTMEQFGVSNSAPDHVDGSESIRQDNISPLYNDEQDATNIPVDDGRSTAEAEVTRASAADGLERHIFYRIYARDGALPTKQRAAVVEDIFLGRLDVTSVAPPQTVASLKRRICKVENIVHHDAAAIYKTGTRTELLNGNLPIATLGASPNDPVIVVVELFSETLLDKSRFKRSNEADQAPYIRYRLFANDAALPSRNGVTTDEGGYRYLGRISRTLVTPPYTAVALKRAVLRAERLPQEWIAHCQVYLSLRAKEPVAKKDMQALFSGEAPGEAIALVFAWDRDSFDRKVDDSLRWNYVVGTMGSDAAERTNTFFQYVLFDPSGPFHSKRYRSDCKANSDQARSVSRISTLHLPPPQDASSLKRNIFKYEGLDSFKIVVKVFKSISSERPMAVHELLEPCGKHSPLAVLITRAPWTRRMHGWARTHAKDLCFYATTSVLLLLMVYYWRSAQYILKIECS